MTIHVTHKSQCDTKSPVQDFVNTIQTNPREIIAWAKREIKEYQSLIKILESKVKCRKHGVVHKNGGYDSCPKNQL